MSMTRSSATTGPWLVERAPLTRQLCVMSPTTWICGQLQSDNHAQIDTKECLANARLIAEAGTVLHETGLSPRELADERDRLREALTSITIYLVEEDERVWLAISGKKIVGIQSDTAEAMALLQLDAKARSALAQREPKGGAQ